MRPDSEVEAKFNIMRFLTSKLNRYSRVGAISIIKSLSDKRAKGDDEGWVRARNLYNEFVRTGEISHSTQFFRILDKFTEFGVVEKELRKKEQGEPGGKSPVYYRVPIIYPISWFEEPIEDPIDTMARRSAELYVARKWIGELTGLEPEIIKAKIKDRCRKGDLGQIILHRKQIIDGD